jgi:hypothetical protein
MINQREELTDMRLELGKMREDLLLLAQTKTPSNAK